MSILQDFVDNPFKLHRDGLDKGLGFRVIVQAYQEAGCRAGSLFAPSQNISG